jgi:hypothetical protein
MDSAGGDLRLRLGSPAVNAGDVSALPPDIYDLDSDGDTAEAIPVDLAFKNRVQAGVLDMGAYETPGSSVSAVTLLLLDQ